MFPNQANFKYFKRITAKGVTFLQGKLKTHEETQTYTLF